MSINCAENSTCIYKVFVPDVLTCMAQSVIIDENDRKSFDVVIEATGSTGGFETSLSLTKPRGVLVLKSTIAAKEGFNLAPVVIDEITVLGSRCGQFAPAIRLLEKGKINIKPLISEIYPVDKALEAFEKNKQKDILKVLLKF